MIKKKSITANMNVFNLFLFHIWVVKKNKNSL